MSRVALVCSEPLRAQMAGIGIRYLELARRLPAQSSAEIVLVTAGEPADVPEVPEGVEVRSFERGGLARLLADCDGAVAQGQLANDILVEVPELPCAIDLYDPWLVENMHYVETLGLGPYRNDHATWVLQMSRGDFFLCSSEEQRNYYLGFLTAVGRVNPEILRRDPDLQRLIAPVPFGVPGFDDLPAHEPVLPPREAGEKRLLFGGLYDWYDPFTLLEALERLEKGEGDASGWRLLFIRNPNAGSTPQRLFAEVEARCRKRGWWGEKVLAQDWLPAARRYDLLRDVDLMVAPHRPSLETRLSLRTRFLDALACGCPAVTSEGGAMSSLLLEHHAGWVVPPEDPEALASALRQILTEPEEVDARRQGARELAQYFAWDRVLEPLADFCRRPWRDTTKHDFAAHLATATPPDSLAFRLRRKLRGVLR